jgi:DNA-binding YbaB/EbfC family protein
VTFDLEALLKQAEEMQAQVQKLQEEAANQTVSATAGGGVVTVVATAGGEIREITIDPKAIDPSEPELLADLVLAAVNEALRNGQALLQSKLGEALPPGLHGLLPGL